MKTLTRKLIFLVLLGTRLAIGLSAASPESPPARAIMLDAKPSPVALDAAKTAVIVVDMQNDFGAKGGLLDLLGKDISGIQKVIEPTARVLASARAAGVKVIYLKMAFLADLSDAGPVDAPNRIGHLRAGAGKPVHAPDGSQSRVLIRDTWNTEILSELKPEPDDIVIYKHRFSGFFETNLDDVLKKLGVSHLIITGCTTSVCVESTIRDAYFRDYHCVLLADCTAEPMGSGFPRSNYEASLYVVEHVFGSVSKSAEMVNAFKASRASAK